MTLSAYHVIAGGKIGGINKLCIDNAVLTKYQSSFIKMMLRTEENINQSKDGTSLKKRKWTAAETIAWSEQADTLPAPEKERLLRK
jgi:hypothetical protein